MASGVCFFLAYVADKAENCFLANNNTEENINKYQVWNKLRMFYMVTCMPATSKSVKKKKGVSGVWSKEKPGL